jgi:hypothetical protein
MIDPNNRTTKIIAGSLFVLGLAWQQIEATRLGYEVERSRREARILRGRIGAIEIQLETSLSPARLSAQAKMMGMIPSEPAQLRVLDDGKAAPQRESFFSRLLAKGLKAQFSSQG